MSAADSWRVELWEKKHGWDGMCSFCRKRLVVGEPIVWLNKGTKTHRLCLKKFLQYSYDVIPPSRVEEAMDPHASVIDTAMSQREFESYRNHLLKRYGIVGGDTNG